MRIPAAHRRGARPGPARRSPTGGWKLFLFLSLRNLLRGVFGVAIGRYRRQKTRRQRFANQGAQQTSKGRKQGSARFFGFGRRLTLEPQLQAGKRRTGRGLLQIHRGRGKKRKLRCVEMQAAPVEQTDTMLSDEGREPDEHFV